MNYSIRFKAIIISIILILAAFTRCSAEGNRLDLSTDWKVKKSSETDNYSKLNIDDLKWESIDLPKIISNERKRSIFWLRKTFVMPDDFKGKTLALNIGKIWEVDETYINGVRIGANGKWFPDFFSLWNYHRYYLLPENILKYNEQNTIAIKIMTNHSAMFEGSPFISDTETVRIYVFWKRFLSEYIAISLTVLSLFLCIISLVQYLSYRKYRLPLFYSITALVMSITVIQWYLPTLNGLNYTVKDNIYYILLAAVSTMFYFMFISLLELRFRVLNYIILLMLFAVIILTATADENNPIQGWRMDYYFIIVYSMTIIWAIAIIKAFINGKTRDATILSGSFLILVATTLHDALMMLSIIEPGTFIAPIGYHLLFITIGVVMAFKTSEIMRGDELKRYLPQQLVNSILKGRHHVTYENERRKLTIFFSDLQGFTETTDNLEAEELTRMLNEYLTEMTVIANRYGGTIDKFIGDAIMIFFGAPDRTDDKDHAIRCVRMAMEMQTRMKILQNKWFDEGIEYPLSVRIGINTGLAMVGNFGAEERLSYTAIGGQVNLASRLEGVCEAGGILISHSTYALIKDEIQCEQKGKITVKGIHREILTYSVMLS